MQVDKNNYKFEKYSYLERWGSYYYQIKEALKSAPKNILEIGAGDGVFGDHIKRNTTISYKSLDVAPDLNPDVVGDILSLPFPDDSFDVIVAYEVLEHIPYENFEKALSEVARVSKKHAVISLPHFGPPIKFSIKIPFLPEIKIALKLPYPKKHVFNGQHYWEIGKKGYSPRKIKKVLEKHFEVIKDYVPFENQYHHFYILEKKS